MKLMDVQDPFFAPLWRRIAVVAFCLGWAGFEFAFGSRGFAMLFGGLGLYCVYQFFVVFNPKAPETAAPESAPDDTPKA